MPQPCPVVHQLAHRLPPVLPPCRPHPRYRHGQARQGVSGWPPGWCSCSAGAPSLGRPRSRRRGRSRGQRRGRQRSAPAALRSAGGGPASGGGRAREGAAAGAGGWRRHVPRLAQPRDVLPWKHSSVTHARRLAVKGLSRRSGRLGLLGNSVRWPGCRRVGNLMLSAV